MKRQFMVQLSNHTLCNPLLVSIRSLTKTLETNAKANQFVESIQYVDVPRQIVVTVSDSEEESSELQQDVTFEKNTLRIETSQVKTVQQAVELFRKVGKYLFELVKDYSRTHIESITQDDQGIQIVITTNEKQKPLEKKVTPIKNERLLLIDTSNLLARGYFATLNSVGLMQTSDGRYTNGVYSLIQSFFSLLKTFKPTHVCFAIDESRDKTWRKELYPEYKGLRESSDPELKEQFNTLFELLQKMNVPQLKIDTLEADDVIGILTKKWRNEKPRSEVFIVSSDKDLYQLLDEHVTQVAFHKGKTYQFTEADFRDKYGVSPKQWIDCKALLGEKGKSSDNIPGCDGVGEKAVYPLLQEFGSIEMIYEDLSKLEPNFKRYIKKLEEGKDNVFLSKRLATIITDYEKEIIHGWDDLAIAMDRKGTIQAFQELEFDSLLKRIG